MDRVSLGNDRLAHVSVRPRASTRFGPGFFGIDHLLNSAQIVERLINRPHPD
jgi:hypothetical protein